MLYCELCKKKYIPGNGTFFRVPNDASMLQKWSSICRQEFAKYSVICIDHFLKKDIRTCGQRLLLMPKAMPIAPKFKLSKHCQPSSSRQHLPPEKIGYCSEVEMESQDAKISKTLNGISYFNTEDLTNTASSKFAKPGIKENKFKIQKNAKVTKVKDPKKVFENQEEFVPPQLQEEPIIEISVAKSHTCAGTTQTNTNLCGLVQASELPDEFRLNCFYCSEVFPLEKWINFVNHMREKHSDIKAELNSFNYVSEDQDYIPISTSPPSPAAPILATIDINAKSHQPLLVDPLESVNNPIESVILNPIECYGTDEEKTMSSDIDIKIDLVESDNRIRNSEQTCSISNSEEIIAKSKQLPKKTALSRCLKRTIVEVKESEMEEKFELDSIEIVQLKPTEITFEYTSHEIIDSLLESMRNYPVLWQFNNQPFNEDFYEAVEDLCKIINEKWCLNIDNLKMRRSINRILRFYCYLYPNTNVENIDKFTCYYDKCAIFLPSVVSKIAYARCSHCYICYKNDFDLKRHLLDKHKYLQWPYKCIECKEYFRESDEYEFHKHLPHYDEIFRCEPCNKTFFRRNIYNKHVAERHPNVSKEYRYKCNICGKTYKTNGTLTAHKRYHGERIYKCHLCPKSYFEKAKLTIHLKSHRKQFDYMCEICGKEFLIKKGLKVHMKKHTGEKITCSICNLKLRKSSLSRHMRLLHVAYEGTIETTLKGRHLNYKRMRTPNPFPGRTCHCKICEMNFENYKLLAEHNKEFHFDIANWPCKICSTHFSHRFNLKRHYRRHHKLHLIQIYKLVDEHEDLNVVLALDKEDLERLAHKFNSKSKRVNVKKSNIENEVKSKLLLDDINVEEKIHNSQIQDEILKADDKIEADEYFTEYLEEP